MHCAYCDRPATQRIPAVFADACLTHTIEFWNGYLRYAKANPFVAATEAASASRAVIETVPAPASARVGVLFRTDR